MITLSFITAGIISLYKLPVSLVSASDSPAVSILIEYPGISPDKIENLITKPVERIIKGVNGIVEIESVSEEGKSKINVAFGDGTNIKIASLKIREKIELIKDSFPKEVQEPVVYRYDPSERPVVITAVDIEGMEVDRIREVVDRRVKPALQRVEGVSEIYIAGGAIKEIHIETDRSRLEARGLTFNDISTSVRSSNISIPGGMVDNGSGINMLSIPSKLKSLNDIEETIIYSMGKGLISLKDVAVTTFNSREKEDLSRFNGKDLVTIYIHKGGGANTLNVCRDVRTVLDSFSEIKFRLIYNQGEYIESAVNNAISSGISGIIIVFIVLAVFFRRRETVIPISLSIPCSMMIVPLFLYAGHRGINVMSLTGFAMSAGMVVDSGIVIIEAIILNEDKTIRGIIDSVNSVKLAVISSTLTTIAVFAPVSIISSRAESTYGDMSFTVSMSLLVSLFVAIVLIPSFYVTFKNKQGSEQKRIMNNRLSNISTKIGQRIDNLEKSWSSYYSMILVYVFNNSKKIIYLLVLLVFFSCVIFSVMDKDVMTDDAGREFYLYMEFPTGTSLYATDNGVRVVEKIAREMSGVEDVTSKVEKWRGTLTVRTSANTSRKRSDEIKSSLKKNADQALKPLQAFAYVTETDELSSREITVHFLGDDIDTLKKITREASSSIKSIEGIEECYLRYREGRPEFTLSLDRDKCGMSGVTALDASERLRGGLFGPVITKFIDKGREIDVRLRLTPGDRDSIDHILAGKIKNVKGENVPLSEIVNVSENESPSRIYRINGRRSLSVTAKLGSISIFESEYKIRKVLNTMSLPGEYSYQFEKKIDEFRRERSELIAAVAISILLVYMILASLFESLIIPLLIMITIPLAAVGTIPVLYLLSVPISPSVYMGFIMLTGNVVSNGILLVEPVNLDYGIGILNRENLLNIVRASAEQRFRPVMLTVVTTVVGLIPLLIGGGEGSSLWFPFALTVTSGLVFSTLFSVAVFPLLTCRLYQFILKNRDDFKTINNINIMESI